MSDNKNNFNSQQDPFANNTPFSKKPFSEDVWERAYKNVGRPFESMNKDADKAVQNNNFATSKTESTITVSKPQSSQKPKPEAKKALQQEYSSPAYTEHQESYASKFSEKKQEEQENLLEMLGNISSLEDLIAFAKKVKNNKTFEKPGFWIAALVLIIYVISIISAVLG